MKEDVAQFIKWCILCCTRKTRSRKWGLYHPSHVPTKPWERISMYFVGGIQTTRKGHDYLFVVVDIFSKICILIPCKNTIIGKEAENMFFEQVWVHFGIPKSIISDMDTKWALNWRDHTQHSIHRHMGRQNVLYLNIYEKLF